MTTNKPKLQIDLKKLFQQIFLDPAAISLVITNVAIIYLAIKYQWTPGLILWTYWSQSIVIGTINFIRMMRLKDYSTEGYLVDNKPVPADDATKKSTALFFAFHYGFFHFVYAIFLATEFGLPPLGQLALNVLPFIANHAFSYLYYVRLTKKTENIGMMMFFPYVRIIPMHLTIILGGFLGGAIAIFMVFKTIADLTMHYIEHGEFNF